MKDTYILPKASTTAVSNTRKIENVCGSRWSIAYDLCGTTFTYENWKMAGGVNVNSDMCTGLLFTSALTHYTLYTHYQINKQDTNTIHWVFIHSTWYCRRSLVQHFQPPVHCILCECLLMILRLRASAVLANICRLLGRLVARRQGVYKCCPGPLWRAELRRSRRARTGIACWISVFDIPFLKRGPGRCLL